MQLQLSRLTLSSGPLPIPRGLDDEEDEGARNPGSNLFVTGIHPNLTEEEVTRLFEKYGEVEKCNIMRDPHTKESRGFGFVKMVTSEQADAAKEGLQGEVHQGRTLSIEKARRAKPRTPTPGKYYGPPKRGKLLSCHTICTLLTSLQSLAVEEAAAAADASAIVTATGMTTVAEAEVTAAVMTMEVVAAAIVAHATTTVMIVATVATVAIVVTATTMVPAELIDMPRATIVATAATTVVAEEVEDTMTAPHRPPVVREAMVMPPLPAPSQVMEAAAAAAVAAGPMTTGVTITATRYKVKADTPRA
jgi:hypothetical protein